MSDRSPLPGAFCHYSMLTRVVFISHLCRRPFEWKQWGLLPWTLFHGSKDKREAWKEETRPVQKPKPTRAAQIIRVPCSPPARLVQERLAPGSRERRNCAGFTTRRQLWSSWGNRRNKLKQAALLFVFCPIRAAGLGRGQRSKQKLIKMITLISMVHALLAAHCCHWQHADWHHWVIIISVLSRE